MDTSETVKSKQPQEYIKQELDIEVEDFQKICRTCLSRDKLKAISKVSHKDGVQLTELFKHYLEVDTTSNPQMPQNICMKCTKEIWKFFGFKEQVLKYDLLFRQIITKKDQVFHETDFANDKKFEILRDDDDDLHADLAADSPGSCSDDDVVKQEEPNADETIKSETIETFKQEDDYSDEDDIPLILRFPKSENGKEEQDGPQDRARAAPKTKVCKYCSKEVVASKMSQHLRVHTKEKPFECNVCQQSFSLAGNLRRHKMIHTGERPHVCQICGKGFIQAPSLQAHLKVHESGGGYVNAVCEVCGRHFKRYTAYRMHMLKHDEVGERCDGAECAKAAATADESQKAFACTACGRKYKTKHLLKAHLVTHGERKFLCSECGKKFFTKAALESHFRTHTGEKPHTCSICAKSFSHATSFDTHMLSHTGVRPHKCVHCDKKFQQPSHLKYHMRTHSGERPFTCSYCGKTFALKGNLTVHVRTHTGETPYLCVVCNKGFYDSSSLKKHRRSHNINAIEDLRDDVLRDEHGGEFHLCAVCGKTFYELEDLEKHKRCHRQTVETFVIAEVGDDAEQTEEDQDSSN